MSQSPNPLPVTVGTALVPPGMQAPAESAVHGRVVGVIIFMAVAIFLSAVTLLYYRWLTVSVPSAELLVTGTQLADGASVTVTGPSLATPLTVIVGAQTQHVARFYLDPGYYTFRVTMAGQRQVLAERSVTLQAGRLVRSQLSDPSPQTPEPDGARSP